MKAELATPACQDQNSGRKTFGFSFRYVTCYRKGYLFFLILKEVIRALGDAETVHISSWRQEQRAWVFQDPALKKKKKWKEI